MPRYMMVTPLQIFPRPLSSTSSKQASGPIPLSISNNKVKLRHRRLEKFLSYIFSSTTWSNGPKNNCVKVTTIVNNTDIKAAATCPKNNSENAIASSGRERKQENYFELPNNIHACNIICEMSYCK